MENKIKIPTKLPQDMEEYLTETLEMFGANLEVVAMMAYQKGYEKGIKKLTPYLTKKRND